MAGGFISDEDIQKVREATDLAQLVAERVQLKPKGRELWGCCPLHHEKTPSFKVDPASGFWHCFGCDEGGDMFGFVMKLDNLSFPEAVRKLAERAGIEVTASEAPAARGRKERLKDVCAVAEEFFHMQLMRGRAQGCNEARSYLSSRGLGGNVPKEWMLGFAPGRGTLVAELSRRGFTPDEMISANVAVSGKGGALRDRFFNRVMFPIHDISGKCIAFGGRVIGEGNPKYLNSQETPIFHKSQVLYGLDKAKAAMASTGCAIVTEGYTDVIAMHGAGLSNAVATLGTALGPAHIRQLARQAGRRIVYLFDGDEAGQRATERALQFIDDSVTPEAGTSKIDICALSLPDGKDPAEFLASSSADEMRRLVDGAKPLILYGIERRLERHGKATAEDRARALADALDVLLPIKESILAKDYAAQIADMLGYRVDDVMGQLARMKPARRAAATQASVNGTEVSMAAGAGARMGAGAASAAASRAGANPGTRSTQGAPQGTPALTFDSKPSEPPDYEAVPYDELYDAPMPQVRMSASESNRLRIERELLALCCMAPLDAIANGEAISEIRWHDALNSQIASALLESLMEDLSATPATLLAACNDRVPGADRVLTGSVSSSQAPPSELMRYMLEELAINDLEGEIASLKTSLSAQGSLGSQLSDASAPAPPESAFGHMVELQGKLADIKKRHTPVV